MNDLDIAVCSASELTKLLRMPDQVWPTMELLQKIQRVRPDLNVNVSLSRDGWLIGWYIVEVKGDNMKIKVRVLSDMHVGSRHGLIPRHLWTNDTAAYQRWLTERWEEMLAQDKLDPPDIVVLLGDIIDGGCQKNVAELAISSVGDQCREAANLIRPYLLMNPGVEFLGVDGSRYHDADQAVHVTRVLNGVHRPQCITLDLAQHGLRPIRFFHKSTTPKTEIDNLFNEFANYNISCKIPAEKYVMPFMLVSGHLHRYVTHSERGVYVVQSPCWEWATDFMGPNCKGTNIGAISILIDTDRPKITADDDFNIQVPQSIVDDMKASFVLSSAKLAEIGRRQAAVQLAEAQIMAEANGQVYESSRPVDQRERVKTEAVDPKALAYESSRPAIK